MFHIYAHDRIRQLEEERRLKSMRRSWWRHANPEPEPTPSRSTTEAEVIELAFGAQCDAEEPIGA